MDRGPAYRPGHDGRRRRRPAADKEILVTCQAQDITDTEGSMIVSMVDNGMPCEKGDELCRFEFRRA